jgi:hypothetical protein
MVRVGKDVAELGMAPHAAAVLGRAGSPASEADGLRHPVGRQDLFDEHVMLPEVAEVVGVAQPGAGPGGEVAQPGLALVGGLVPELEVGSGVAATVNLERVPSGRPPRRTPPG